MFCAVVLAALSIFLASILYPDNVSVRNLISLVFFFKPMFAYFSAALLVSNFQIMKSYLRTMAIMILVLVLSVIFSIAIFHGFLVRAESEINGSFFGLPLFGSYGVNSLAAFYVLLSFICLALYSLGSSSSSVFRFTVFIAFLGSIYLVFGSLSRMAVAGTIPILFYAWKELRNDVRLISIGFVCLLGISIFVSGVPTDGVGFSGAKADQIKKGVEQGDLDYISSGRLTLYSIALQEVARNPIMGTYFGGYQTHVSSIAGFDTVVGLSPHNQYITAIWKMGVPGALMYFLFLYMIFLKIRSSPLPFSRKWGKRLLFIVLVIFSNLWDVLMVPNVGALFFFSMGLFIYGGQNRRED